MKAASRLIGRTAVVIATTLQALCASSAIHLTATSGLFMQRFDQTKQVISFQKNISGFVLSIFLCFYPVSAAVLFFVREKSGWWMSISWDLLFVGLTLSLFLLNSEFTSLYRFSVLGASLFFGIQAALLASPPLQAYLWARSTPPQSQKVFILS